MIKQKKFKNFSELVKFREARAELENVILKKAELFADGYKGTFLSNIDNDILNIEKWNGLKVEWGSRNFVNPPYSRKLKEAFVKKGIEEAKKGKKSVFLLPVSTSTVLFHDYILPNISEPIRFLRGRVKFEGINTFGDHVTNKCGMHDSMIVIF